MKSSFPLFLMILFYSTNIFPRADNDTTGADEALTLSRLKLSGGYFAGGYSEIGMDSHFLNLNYRATEISRYKNSFDAGLSFEAGINFIKGIFPFYVKAGPETKIANNLILGANAGLLGIFIYPGPFYGFNTFYLIEISKNIFFELEGDFISPFRMRGRRYFTSIWGFL